MDSMNELSKSRAILHSVEGSLAADPYSGVYEQLQKEYQEKVAIQQKTHEKFGTNWGEAYNFVEDLNQEEMELWITKGE